MTEQRLLTEKLAATLKPPKTGRLIVRDTVLQGFCLQVTPTGAKSFYAVKRAGRSVQRLMVGRWPQVAVAHARRMAAAIIAKISADGRAVQPPRHQARSEATLGETWTWFAATYGTRKRTLPRDVRTWERDLSDWSTRPLSSIARRDILDRMESLHSERGMGAARKFLELIRILFRRAIQHREWPGLNPTTGIPVPRPAERERFLRPDEIPKFFEALGELQSRTARDFFAMCLFTGARRSNVASMRWDEVSIESRTWTIPAAKYKGKRDNAVMLSPETLEILDAREEFRESEFVFPGRSRGGHYNCPKDAWNRLCVSAGLAGLRIHDLRRTLGSYLASTNASLPIIGKVLGHRSQRATAVYSRLNTDPVREAIDKAIAAITAARGPENQKKG